MNETSTIKVIGRNNTVTYIDNLDGIAWSSGEVKRHNPESVIQINDDPVPTTDEPNLDGLAWDSEIVKRKDAQVSSNESNPTTPEPNQDGLAWVYEDYDSPKREQFQWSKLFLWSDQFLWFDRLGIAFDQHRELMRDTVEKVHSLDNE
ncbi:hypothetical protein DdX_21411 [Ditylenchus destructor]|uniref:Uncharacterized protein n=1 Tax=Ditylenchus destructor TaxID=166010 RepID=A0AAD4MF11_9BILA|nr:hypothetical protein DdX_21411 [Ditylenchus destructor]